MPMSKTTLLILIIGVTAVTLGAGVYIAYDQRAESPRLKSEEPCPTTEEKKDITLNSEERRDDPEGTEQGEIDTSNWRVYRIEELGISLTLPPDWKLAFLSPEFDGIIRQSINTSQGEYKNFFFAIEKFPNSPPGDNPFTFIQALEEWESKANTLDQAWREEYASCVDGRPALAISMLSYRARAGYTIKRTRVFVPSEKMELLFYMEDYNSGKEPRYREFLKQILAGVQFLELNN